MTHSVLELDQLMQPAINEARTASTPPRRDIPIGAAVYDEEGRLLASAGNRREADEDPTAHAEILALREAARVRGRWNLSGCTLVVTLEPCTMCAGAIVLARIKHLVVGAMDPKAGAAGSLYDLVREERLNHRVELTTGVRAEECGDMLRDFFRALRERRKGLREG
ncbi:nucleoside deaminase [Dermabacter vaginalis]|uniref:nucleoside deaminase n=1 Tax=Dermabacter vaginalis TaxID=1630135 RepID=UPI0035CCFD71